MMPPYNIKSFWGRLAAQTWAMIIEHNITNVVRQNFHKIDDDMYRSSQPTTYQLRERIQKYGFKTIINLRGYPDNSPLKALEEDVCNEMGVKLIYVEAFSRKIPDIKTLLALNRVFEDIEYPAMLHCKSGADRAGLASVLYSYWIVNKSMRDSVNEQLRLIPFGHIKYARTGLIDYFFNAFMTQNSEQYTLLEWAILKMESKREKLEQEYQAMPIWDIIVEKILKRE
jgi:protein tyrosine/serine phosphatase